MKKLLILTALMAPSVAVAQGGIGAAITAFQETGQLPPAPKNFINNDTLHALPWEHRECFYERRRECPVVYTVGGEIQNPEDEPAARECQEQALTACQAMPIMPVRRSKELVDEAILNELIGDEFMCFIYHMENCPTVWEKDGVIENPEDIDAARECQERAVATCKAMQP